MKVGGMTPASLLIVCVGNTCRSPMAEAFARRLWPHCAIKSAGIGVLPESEGAADEAVAAMASFDFDISHHRPTPIDKVNLDKYAFILALDKDVYRKLSKKGVVSSKIIKMFVSDPYGDDPGQYVCCARFIRNALKKVSFPLGSN